MSLARKMKRQTVEKVKDSVSKELKSTIRMDARGRVIAEKMHKAIEDMCWATTTPLFLWVLRRDFGFGADRLYKVSEEFNRHIQLVNETGKADDMRKKGMTLPVAGGPFPHHYLSLEEMAEGLEIEAKYKFDFTPLPNKLGEGATQKDFEDWHVTKIADIHRDDLRLVWLYSMWSVFGFGKGRLEKLNANLLEEVKHLTPQRLDSYMVELEKCDKKGDRISFKRTRKILQDCMSENNAA